MFGFKGNRGRNGVADQPSRSARPEISRVPWKSRTGHPTPGLSISAFFIGIIGIGIMTLFVIFMIKYVNLEFVDYNNKKPAANPAKESFKWQHFNSKFFLSFLAVFSTCIMHKFNLQ